MAIHSTHSCNEINNCGLVVVNPRPRHLLFRMLMAAVVREAILQHSVHHCPTSFIYVRESTHEFLTDSCSWKSDRGWKSTTIVIAIGNIDLADNRRREAKIGNDAIHEFQGSITKDTLFIGVNYDTSAPTALCPFSLVGDVS